MDQGYLTLLNNKYFILAVADIVLPFQYKKNSQQLLWDEANMICVGNINLVSRLLFHFIRNWGTSLCC